MNEVYLPDIVGDGYNEFWHTRARYRVVKGSRASKKSKTTALWYIYNLLKFPAANLLVVRRTYRSLERSAFAELKWAIRRLGAEKYFESKTAPLEIVCKPTGQRIFFAGLDDPLKLTSITVATGVLCWMWIEEAYEIESEDAFNTLDESIRGSVPDGLFKQITLTFNPWSANHWLKRRFFDVQSPDIFAMTVNYKVNEWLDDADLRVFEDMRLRDPERYRVCGLGEWGIGGGQFFPEFRSDIHIIRPTPLVCGARIFRTGEVAVAEGDFALMGQGKLKLSYLTSDDEVLIGDQIVTSGLGGYYPSGLVIGSVESLQTGDDGLARYAVLAPMMNFAALTEVFVITDYDIVD